MSNPEIIDFGEISLEQFAEASHYSIEIRWSPEDEAYLASVPELPGTVTHGGSAAEAANMAIEAAALWIAAARHFGRPIPAPRLAALAS